MRRNKTIKTLVIDVLDTYKEISVGHWKSKSRFLGKAEARNKN